VLNDVRTKKGYTCIFFSSHTLLHIHAHVPVCTRKHKHTHTGTHTETGADAGADTNVNIHAHAHTCTHAHALTHRQEMCELGAKAGVDVTGKMGVGSISRYVVLCGSVMCMYACMRVHTCILCIFKVHVHRAHRASSKATRLFLTK